MDSIRLNEWIEITPDNITTIIVNKSEMGQGVYTSLPMILADELEADWSQIRVMVAPAAEEYKDPAWDAQGTGGSTSVMDMHDPLRKAGAAVREMLVSAAAEQWSVPVSECEAFRGTIRHKDGRTLTYGQLAMEASKLPIPRNPTLKKENERRLVNTSVPRVDIPEKVNGSAIFGTDVFIPDMLYAAVIRSPTYGAKMISYDRRAAGKVPGVRHVVQIQRGIAVCADTLDSAWKGNAALKVQWSASPSPDFSSESLETSFMKALSGKGLSARDDGDTRTALQQAHKKLNTTYVLPYLAHTTMEPMNCAVYVQKDRCDAWVPTQNQTGVLQLIVKETGLKPDQIHVNTPYVGGGFGRRFETDSVEEALQLSKATGKPIKLIWTREEDIRNDFYRPANCSRMEGGIDQTGRLVAWSHRVACPSIFSRIFPQMVEDGIDPAAVEGLKNMDYEIPNLHVEYVRIDTPVPVGFWRSVGNSHNAFTVECFIDELAFAAKKDPLEFRLSHLKNHPRNRRVLELAAEKAGWGKPLENGMGRGIAQHFSFGSYVAQVAEVSVDKTNGKIKVHKVVCAVDCGRVIHPDTVVAQMEGGIIFGLSAALKEKVEFQEGGVKSSNFKDYDILRIKETPDIEVHIVRSDQPLGGIGEPGVPPIAPAVANAVFRASGVRIRRLPLTPKTVMETSEKE